MHEIKSLLVHSLVLLLHTFYDEIVQVILILLIGHRLRKTIVPKLRLYFRTMKTNIDLFRLHVLSGAMIVHGQYTSLGWNAAIYIG